MTSVTGQFQLAGWDEATYQELDGDAKLTRARISQDYSGDGIEVRGAAEALLCYRHDGTATFVGLQHLTGQIAGRSGSFVLQLTGAYDGVEARCEFFVVPGSGSGDLAGLQGKGSYAAQHGPTGTFTFDYELVA